MGRQSLPGNHISLSYSALMCVGTHTGIYACVCIHTHTHTHLINVITWSSLLAQLAIDNLRQNIYFANMSKRGGKG